MSRIFFYINKVSICIYLTAFIGISLIQSCGENHPAKEPVIVKTPEQMDDQVSANIKAVIEYAKDKNGKINDSITLAYTSLVADFYGKNSFKNIWSHKEMKTGLADSLISFIVSARYYGLFPSQYHLNEITFLNQKLISDTLAKKDATLWTKLDLLSTDAFFSLLKDLKESRTVADSNSIIQKQYFIDSFFILNLQKAFEINQITSILQSVEPTYFKYSALRNAMKVFVDNMDTTKYTEVVFPYQDSIKFVKSLYKRLKQEGVVNNDIDLPDSLELAKAVKGYQTKKKLASDGKAGPATIKKLNTNDLENFKRLAVTLDRFKMLPPMPESYVWVNIPAFYLEVWQNDSLVLKSKVIVGKPATPTPRMTSNINNMVTFPNWTIPASIIKKDILPQLKVDPGYLARKGYNLYKENGEVVDPYSVNWNKYKSGIPWKVVQGSGDDNALGIFKFNFKNPYSVYLHDTNQRYLFGNSNRALSHGCVRVQKWQALADYIADRDSSLMDANVSLTYTKDSIQNWIVERSRKSIMVKNKLPLFIEYFGCSASEDGIVFYDDIYNEDAALIKRFYNKG